MASEQWSVMEEPSEPTPQVLAHPVGSWLVLPADVGTLVPGGIPGKGGEGGRKRELASEGASCLLQPHPVTHFIRLPADCTGFPRLPL